MKQSFLKVPLHETVSEFVEIPTKSPWNGKSLVNAVNKTRRINKSSEMERSRSNILNLIVFLIADQVLSMSNKKISFWAFGQFHFHWGYEMRCSAVGQWSVLFKMIESGFTKSFQLRRRQIKVYIKWDFMERKAISGWRIRNAFRSWFCEWAKIANLRIWRIFHAFIQWNCKKNHMKEILQTIAVCDSLGGEF